MKSVKRSPRSIQISKRKCYEADFMSVCMSSNSLVTGALKKKTFQDDTPCISHTTILCWFSSTGRVYDVPSQVNRGARFHSSSENRQIIFYLSKIHTFNSTLKFPFLLSRSGNSFLKWYFVSRKKSTFYLIEKRI